MVKDELNVAVVQMNIAWEDKAENFARVGEWLAGLEGVDLVVLPEMWSTGFSMSPDRIAEPMDGPSVEQMQRWAGELNAAVVGSLAIVDDGRYYNRMIMAEPEGGLQWYDKRHLFALAGENKVYTAGDERKVWEWRGWRLCPMVCYDLRFPCWSRNWGADFDVLIYVANWPAVRAGAWERLLPARAIENQAYVVACNRVGQDQNGHLYNGGSGVYGYGGARLNSAEPNAGILRKKLVYNELITLRLRYPFLQDIRGGKSS